MADHIEFLNALGKIRNKMNFFPDSVQQHVAKLQQTLNCVYREHKHVCEIVAGKAVSIAGQRSIDAPIAAESLVGFAKRALKRIGQSVV